MNKVLVIIVTYNGMKWIDRCLGSVYASGMAADAFVVDNGSTDGTVEHVREHFPSAILHCSGENLGFGRANNIGMRYALDEGYEYVYLLNQDAWVFPDTFARLSEAMSGTDYGVLSPMQMTASLEKPDPRFAAKCISRCPELEAYYRTSSGVYSGKGSDEIVDVPFVMAAHWMISRACLEAVGGFSPAFTHYGEDDNWLHRAIYHGFMVGFVPGVPAVHDREMRPMSKASAMRLKCVASVVKVSNPLNCLPWRLFIQPFELLGISMFRRSSDVLRHIPGFIRSYPSMIRFRRISRTTPCAFL